MILIADSGSTKTEWTLLDEKTRKIIARKDTLGINPYFQNSRTIFQEVLLDLSVQYAWKNRVSKVYFYGAGCSNDEKKQIVEVALAKAFPQAESFIQNDLLGAARALCHQKEGIVCIMGTGSNACFYDGNDIIYQLPSLGFWLGDEGSGGYMGKKLVTAYLQQELPKDLIQRMYKKYQLNLTSVLEAAYNKPFPNRYFASFAPFLYENINNVFCRTLVYDSFCDFLDKYVCKIENYYNLKIHCVGSIAFNFRDILQEIAKNKNIIIENIQQSPMQGLILYHQQNA